MFRKAREVLRWIGTTDRVLDVGGATEVFPRADAVIDAQDYERRTRGQLAELREHFTRDTWYVGDVCSPQVWRHFGDKSFDFVICSHTLEDVRDPLFVCAEMIRVGKAGYIECPSRFRECAKTRAEDIHSGWNHHRWIVDVESDTLVFTPKLHWADLFDYLGEERRFHLHNYYNSFVGIHWVGSFDYVERAAKGPPREAENLFHFYDQYPYDSPPAFHTIQGIAHRGTTFQWETEFLLPIEQVLSPEEIVERFRKRLSEFGGALPG